MSDKQDVNITVKIQGLSFIFWIVMLAFALGFATSSILDLIDAVWCYAP